ncbi:hypothetical protein SAMN05444344_0512 [Tenacibaculum mesophilum]|uniref:Lipocalin-like domain-containing protein n=1 Tax=Tenacibaculum mesophilum TaxID=104268 RepID=A0ABN5T8H6_9FLAO|nr:hypothetical protein [Tenacibaculum mesophilum]AZJ33673.1 hypothetical protein D6200_14285 [Tenacibaculum mesophilum]QFS28914.1 hypothetical protein F9Y86_11095 [Tenacibaculum mesophilum]SHF56049.1 hypothetical protein SAMN05444344_0512 [Tenacibaculum mesophilum]
MIKQLLLSITIGAFFSCSKDNHKVIDDIPDSNNIEEQIVGRWMPVQTLLNNQVTYDRNIHTGLENDTHYERRLYKEDKTVRLSNSDGSINLFTWELNPAADSITIAKGLSNERRYLIEYLSKDSLSFSIEPFSGHKVVYNFSKEHNEAIHRSDLIAKDWKYDFVWARLFSMDGYKYVRNGSVSNDFYENAKVSFHDDGSFIITSGNNTIHEQGTWHLNLDDMQLVIEGDYKREATLLELNEHKMVFVFKNPQDNNTNYQMDFSTY